MTSAVDFGTDLINFVLQRDVVPSIPKYENEIAQSAREIFSIMMPTGITGAGIKALTKFGKARAGWNIGNTPFMRFLGDRAAETLGSVAVGAVSREYEKGDNILGMAKKALLLNMILSQTL